MLFFWSLFGIELFEREFILKKIKKDTHEFETEKKIKIMSHFFLDFISNILKKFENYVKLFL